MKTKNLCHTPFGFTPFLCSRGRRMADHLWKQRTRRRRAPMERLVMFNGVWVASYSDLEVVGGASLGMQRTAATTWTQDWVRDNEVKDLMRGALSGACWKFSAVVAATAQAIPDNAHADARTLKAGVLALTAKTTMPGAADQIQWPSDNALAVDEVVAVLRQGAQLVSVEINEAKLRMRSAAETGAKQKPDGLANLAPLLDSMDPTSGTTKYSIKLVVEAINEFTGAMFNREGDNYAPNRDSETVMLALDLTDRKYFSDEEKRLGIEAAIGGASADQKSWNAVTTLSSRVKISGKLGPVSGWDDEVLNLGVMEKIAPVWASAIVLKKLQMNGQATPHATLPWIAELLCVAVTTKDKQLKTKQHTLLINCGVRKFPAFESAKQVQAALTKEARDMLRAMPPVDAEADSKKATQPAGGEARDAPTVTRTNPPGGETPESPPAATGYHIRPKGQANEVWVDESCRTMRCHECQQTGHPARYCTKFTQQEIKEYHEKRRRARLANRDQAADDNAGGGSDRSRQVGTRHGRNGRS